MDPFWWAGIIEIYYYYKHCTIKGQGMASPTQFQKKRDEKTQEITNLLYENHQLSRVGGEKCRMV